MIRALEVFQELVEHAQIPLPQHEGDDSLREEVGHSPIEHPAERADTVVKLRSALAKLATTHHALQVALAGANEVSLQSRCVGIAQTDHVAVVRPDWC